MGLVLEPIALVAARLHALHKCSARQPNLAGEGGRGKLSILVILCDEYEQQEKRVDLT
jgi:hypothetical protein